MDTFYFDEQCNSCKFMVRLNCPHARRRREGGCQHYELALAKPGMDRALIKRIAWTCLWGLLTVICFSQTFNSARPPDRVVLAVLSVLFAFLSGRALACKSNSERG